MNEDNKIKIDDIPEDLKKAARESRDVAAKIAVELLHEIINKKEKEITLLREGVEVVRGWANDDARSVSNILSILFSKGNAGSEVK